MVLWATRTLLEDFIAMNASPDFSQTHPRLPALARLAKQASLLQTASRHTAKTVLMGISQTLSLRLRANLVPQAQRQLRLQGLVALGAVLDFTSTQRRRK